MIRPKGGWIPLESVLAGLPLCVPFLVDGPFAIQANAKKASIENLFAYSGSQNIFLCLHRIYM
jgi:hypothetical protein